MNEKIVDFVRESPRLVKAHDKDNWVSLFSKEGKIEDPVGTRTYTFENLGSFWDAFIASNDITFHSSLDILNGNQVIRDVRIQTKLDSGHEVWTPAHLFYTVKEDGGKLSIVSMYANWNLPKMVFEFLKQKGSILAMTKLSLRILKHLGIPGLWGFTKGFIFGIGGYGEKIIKSDSISKHFADKLDINFKVNEISNIKIINTRSSGFFTSFTFEKEGRKGIGNFKFDPWSKKIVEGKIYYS